MSTLRSLNKTLLAAGLAVATLFSPLASQAAEKLKIGTVVWAGYGPSTSPTSSTCSSPTTWTWSCSSSTIRR